MRRPRPVSRGSAGDSSCSRDSSMCTLSAAANTLGAGPIIATGECGAQSGQDPRVPRLVAAAAREASRGRTPQVGAVGFVLAREPRVALRQPEDARGLPPVPKDVPNEFHVAG